MQYYILDGLADDDLEYCFSALRHVEGVTGDVRILLEIGGSIKGEYPEDPSEVRVYLDEDQPKNIKKGDFIGSHGDLVMVSQEVVDELKNFNIGAVEFCPFTLINHRNRVHSTNYRFVVPEQPYDALNHEASDIDRTKAGTVIGTDEVVLDNKKLVGAPDMFRINDLRLMAFSEPLVKVLQEKYTNFVFDEAEQV